METRGKVKLHTLLWLQVSIAYLINNSTILYPVRCSFCNIRSAEATRNICFNIEILIRLERSTEATSNAIKISAELSELVYSSRVSRTEGITIRINIIIMGIKCTH